MSDDQLNSLFDQLRTHDMAKHALALGNLCLAWGQLEMDSILLLSSLCRITDPTTNNVILSSVDFRDKLNAIKSLGFRRKPSDAWFSELETCINLIDNDLRPERNRMIHDFWLAHPDKVIRMTLRSKVINVKARRKELRLSDTKPITAADITALCIKVFAESGRLMGLRDRLEATPASSPEKS